MFRWNSILAAYIFYILRFCKSRYGEVVDVNLVRDKATGKSKGFAFLAYEDQRSTILAVGMLFLFIHFVSAFLFVY